MVRYENTYKLTADEEEKFLPYKATRIAEDLLQTYIDLQDYSKEGSVVLATKLAEYIKDALKCQGFPRYKFVVQVFIGEKGSQGLNVASRSLWFEETDTFAIAKYENRTTFATATIHAVYFD